MMRRRHFVAALASMIGLLFAPFTRVSRARFGPDREPALAAHGMQRHPQLFGRAPYTGPLYRVRRDGREVDIYDHSEARDGDPILVMYDQVGGGRDMVAAVGHAGLLKVG